MSRSERRNESAQMRVAKFYQTLIPYIQNREKINIPYIHQAGFPHNPPFLFCTLVSTLVPTSDLKFDPRSPLQIRGVTHAPP